MVLIAFCERRSRVAACRAFRFCTRERDIRAEQAAQLILRQSLDPEIPTGISGEWNLHRRQPDSSHVVAVFIDFGNQDFIFPVLDLFWRMDFDFPLREAWAVIQEELAVIKGCVIYATNFGKARAFLA